MKGWKIRINGLRIVLERDTKGISTQLVDGSCRNFINSPFRSISYLVRSCRGYS